MQKEVELEIIRLFSKPLHRPFAEIDKKLNLPTGAARQFLERQGIFERAVFNYKNVPQNKRKK